MLLLVLIEAFVLCCERKVFYKDINAVTARIQNDVASLIICDDLNVSSTKCVVGKVFAGRASKQRELRFNLVQKIRKSVLIFYRGEERLKPCTSLT